MTPGNSTRDCCVPFQSSLASTSVRLPGEPLKTQSTVAKRLAAVDASIRYGYMHVMSNNLSRVYQEDLSNERELRTINKRTILKDKIRSFLESGLPR